MANCEVFFSNDHGVMTLKILLYLGSDNLPHKFTERSREPEITEICKFPDLVLSRRYTKYIWHLQA